MHPTRVVLVLLGAASLAAAAGCRRAEPEAPVTEGPQAVRIELATTGLLRPQFTVSATVQPAPGADWTITAPEAGRVLDLPKGVGDAVKEGDLVARFETPAITADLATRHAEFAAATSRAETARTNATRLGQLLSRGIAPQRDVDEAQRELQDAEAAAGVARAARDAAEQAAARLTLRARFAGVVAERWRQPGDAVATGDAVIRIIDPTRLEVVAAVQAGDLAAVSPGRPARIFNPTDASVVPSQVVSRNAPAEGAPTADVRIALPAGTTLTPGTLLQVDIAGEERPNVVLISRGAVLREGAETYVMVAGSDGHAHRRVVMTGMSAEGKVHIVTGLMAGEQVIQPGPEPVLDGTPVTIVK